MIFDYYKAVVAKLGQKAVDSFVRLYASPGASHFGANAPSQVDLISILEEWLEKRHAPPDSLVQVTVDPKTFSVKQSRSLCRFPMYPRYSSLGDPNVASSFTCVPAGSPAQ